MLLVQKWPFFQVYFFRQYGLGTYLLRYSRTKNASLGYKKKLNKSENWHFSKGVHSCFWSKNGHFSNLFFLGNKGKENVVYDILERKNAFLGYKNKKLKKVQKWTFFQRGEPMVFVQKWRLFQVFFSPNIEQENVFDDILERKNTFLGYKLRSSKRNKIDIFPNPWFWSKNGHYSTFSSMAYKARKNKSLKSRKFDIFPEGLTHRFGRKMAIFPTFFCKVI